MNIFYSNIIDQDIITLDRVEANHCIKALRHDLGDLVYVTDGQGYLYKCIIEEIKDKYALLKIVDKEEKFKRYNVHIAISPIKNHDRLEWFVEKAVEIGVDKISFIKCERTLRKKIRIDRLKKIAITAMKQSLKTSVPIIGPIISIEDFLNSCKADNRFICYLSNDRNFIFDKKICKDKEICILIGPEGDFSEKEINIALTKKFEFLSLGDSRLRSETAGVVACHLANIVLGVNQS